LPPSSVPLEVKQLLFEAFCCTFKNKKVIGVGNLKWLTLYIGKYSQDSLKSHNQFIYNMAFAQILSSSDDEGFADVINRRPCNIRRRLDYFNELDDVDFHARFRLSKECVTEVLEAIEPEISHPTQQ